MRRIALLVVAISALLVLVAVSSTAAEEDMEIDILFPTEDGDDILEAGIKAKPEPPCCHHCVCTKSMPPKCQCTDLVPNACHPGCKKCVCARSHPPMCRCLDIKPHCDPPCPPHIFE